MYEKQEKQTDGVEVLGISQSSNIIGFGETWNEFHVGSAGMEATGSGEAGEV